jgi:hypothetical protein
MHIAKIAVTRWRLLACGNPMVPVGTIPSAVRVDSKGECVGSQGIRARVAATAFCAVTRVCVCVCVCEATSCVQFM